MISEMSISGVQSFAPRYGPPAHDGAEQQRLLQDLLHGILGGAIIFGSFGFNPLQSNPLQTFLP